MLDLINTIRHYFFIHFKFLLVSKIFFVPVENDEAIDFNKIEN